MGDGTIAMRLTQINVPTNRGSTVEAFDSLNTPGRKFDRVQGLEQHLAGVFRRQRD